ncbi:MAG TPA: DNA repair protein RadA [Mycobacteriales bacterium]|nr:DNA repair protein RadA [Mycobacteriales bacterium]
MAIRGVRERATFRCAECSTVAAKWVGRCPECQAWGSVVEHGRAPAAGRVTAPAVEIVEVDPMCAGPVPTGLGEFDRVLGGGLVPGAVVLLAGEPGVGKSTVLLDVAARVARGGGRSLVVSAEESTAQVRLRAERIGALSRSLLLAAETDLAAVIGQVEAVDPTFLVIDSVQTVGHAEVDGLPGGISQVREVATALTRLAKARGMATVLVGHVTKDGSAAGPRTLEHLVDVVLYFDGDRHSRLRLLRAVKNRYGSTEELGCFDLGPGGIVGLPDPSGLFLSRSDVPVPGSTVTVALEGRRALVAEVQALVGGAVQASPRRATSGLDPARLAMVLAVVERRGGVAIGGRDVYTSTVGGARIVEPAADLALALAVAGAAVGAALPPDLVVIGEVGLTGDIRAVRGLDRRLAEARRLGFSQAVVPRDVGEAPPGLCLHPVPNLRSALGFLTGSPPQGGPVVTLPSPTRA